MGGRIGPRSKRSRQSSGLAEADSGKHAPLDRVARGADRALEIVIAQPGVERQSGPPDEPVAYAGDEPALVAVETLGDVVRRIVRVLVSLPDAIAAQLDLGAPCRLEDHAQSVAVLVPLDPDVLARPVLQVDDARYLNAKGAAFVAFVQAGLTDLDQIDRFCPTRRRYEPDAARSDPYARPLEQFVKAYERNRPICETLNSDPALAALRSEETSP